MYSCQTYGSSNLQAWSSLLLVLQGEVPGAAKVAADIAPHWPPCIPYSQHGKQWPDPRQLWQLECQQQPGWQ